MLGLTASRAAMAAWPEDKPVEIVVGFAAGGGTDVMPASCFPSPRRGSARMRDYRRQQAKRR
jgi:hypothetical protein